MGSFFVAFVSPMNVFVVSQQLAMWNVYQLGDINSHLAKGFSNEEEAMITAMRFAKQHQPSRVLRIATNGDTRIVAKFGEDIVY